MKNINKLKFGFYYYFNKLSNIIIPRSVYSSKPTNIHFSISKKCNMKCSYCDYWKDSTTEMTTNEAKEIIQALYEWIGPYYLSFSGGEPTLRNDLPELIEFASKLGIRTTILTNGLLANNKLQEKLFNSGLDNITISLNALDSNIHEKMRGTKNINTEILKNIKNSKFKNKIKIFSIISADNMDEIIPLVKWVKTNSLREIELQSIRPVFGRKMNIKAFMKSNLWPKDRVKIKSLFKMLISMKKIYPISNQIKHLKDEMNYLINPEVKVTGYKCKVGTLSIKVNMDKEIDICNEIFKIKNWNKKELDSFWESKKLDKKRKEINNCNSCCVLKNCNYNKSILDDLKSLRRR